MNFTEYQAKAKTTAIYMEHGTGMMDAILYCALGLAGEAGEVANKVKKLMRDEDTAAMRERICMEIGDVLWYAAMLADEMGVSLNTIATKNLAKLRGRDEIDKIKGEGDER